MGAREPNIAGLPEATPADALGMRALDASTRRILLREGVGRLAVAGSLQGLVLLLRLQAHDARLFFRPGTLRALGTGGAISAGKPRLPGHPILRIRMREPRDTLLAPRTRHDLLLPVDLKVRFIEPAAFPR